ARRARHLATRRRSSRARLVLPPTRRHPLRLLVTGDSLTGYFGPILVDEAAKAASIVGIVSAHYGTGLARPEFVDWSVVARGQVKGHVHRPCPASLPFALLPPTTRSALCRPSKGSR